MATPTPDQPCGPDLSCDEVWRAIDHATFAVLGHVTPSGEPRSSGVVYATDARRLYVAVDPDGWKARQIHDGSLVSLTVTVRRGGLLSLLFPIPPATVTFQARARVYPFSDAGAGAMPPALVKLVPPDRAHKAVVLELAPEGRFVTYGIGVSLQKMRDPVASRAFVPVG
jgi:hypothetical protein